MKPVRRKIRKHFGLTAKQVAVRSQRPWYFQWLVALALFLAGLLVGFWQFSNGDLAAKLQQTTLENQDLQTKLIQAEHQVQIEQASQSNLGKDMNLIQDENIKLKEDLLFYKNMVGHKK